MSRSYKHRPFMSICGGGSGRDGNQIYQALDARDRFRYLESDSPDDYFGQWPPVWYLAMMRK